MQLLWLAVLAAHALPPDRTARRFGIADGNKLDRMAVSDDGSLVVGRIGTIRDAFLLDVEDWSVHTFTPCQVTGVAFLDFDDSKELWFSCMDGTLSIYTWKDNRADPLLDEEGEPVKVEVDSQLSGVWYHAGTDYVYALSVGDTDPTLHVVDPIDFQVDNLAGYPVPNTRYKNFTEGLVVGDNLVVSHEGDNMSHIALGASAWVVNDHVGYRLQPNDIAVSPNGGVYGVDGDGVLGEYRINALEWSPMLFNLPSLNGVAASLDNDDAWIAALGLRVTVWEMEGAAVVGGPNNYYHQSPHDVDNPIQDAVVHDGYLYGGGQGGTLHVSTARPWVYPAKISVTPEEATDGDKVTLVFMVESPGTWEVFRGGDRYGTGALLFEGEATENDQEFQRELTVDDDYDEGINDIYVVLTDDRNLTGHASTDLFVDNPPKPPDLTRDNLEFSDRSLVLSFDGIPDQDLDRYEVYVTTHPFSAADFPTGGPGWDGVTALKTPIVVKSVGGAPVSVRIKPLQNKVKHYVALRAYDQGGLEGQMSSVLSETPRSSFTSADLARERGGTACAATSSQAAGWMVMLVGALALLRRRPALGALAALVLATSGPASAQDDDRRRGPHRDLTRSSGDFEVRYGVIDLADDDINDVYDLNPANILQVEFGPQLFRVFEIDVGTGFFQELAFKVDANGRTGNDRTMLTWWPFMLDGTARLHIVDEQVLVPHARAGVDYVIWSEKFDAGANKRSVRGAKMGTHFGLGVGLLLDTFARRRASLLEAQTGINDSFLVFEYRRQSIDGRSAPWASPVRRGLDFSGRMFTVGLKLDY